MVERFFFFQAEDGIRVWSVTGVQTCALPIFNSLPATVTDAQGGLPLLAPMSEVAGRLSIEAAAAALKRYTGGRRSEERRVGKECRSRWRSQQSKTTRKDVKSSRVRQWCEGPV